MNKKLLRGTSADAMLLMFIRLVTIVLSFVVTRLLSQHLSIHDYGTYSQILLIVSTVTSLTIFGMMDGVNYFYCSETDESKRERYISTIFCLQCIVSGVAGIVIMLLRQVICNGFDNADVGGLLLFAAILPLLQNLLSMLQVLLVSVGRAKMLALRNLIVSLLRLAVVILVVTVIQNVAIVLALTLALDLLQITFFAVILRKDSCGIRFGKIDFKVVGTIVRYCAPLAVFTAINTLNRDIDKYLIAAWTDTETLAVYSNASKVLPFDIIFSSFTTVLLPQVTRQVAGERYRDATMLCKVFLEIVLVSTGILCCASLAAAPQMMELLYSEKYLGGLDVFCIYILVDLARLTNFTMVLTAAGKTAKLMYLGAGALAANAVLNVVLFKLMGIIGPAVATLIVTLGTGIMILFFSAKELKTQLVRFFDLRYLAVFTLESIVASLVLGFARNWLAGKGMPYVLIFLLIGGVYGGGMLLLHGKRLLRDMKTMNEYSKS